MKPFFLRFFFLAVALIFGAAQSVAGNKEAAVIQKEAVANVATFSQGSERKDGKAHETCFSIPQQATLEGGEQTFGGGGSSEDRNQKTKRQKRQHNTHYSSCSKVDGRNADSSIKLFTAFRTLLLQNRDAQQERTKTIRFLLFAAGIDSCPLA